MNKNPINFKDTSTPPTKGRASARERGFTLIELMIAVVIVAILTAIAYPSYTQYVLRSHRTAAKTALQDLASRQERFFTTNNVYATTLAQLGYPPGNVPVPDANSHYYDLSMPNVTNNPGAPSTYGLQAAPFGSQQNDAECGTFTLDELGNQGISGGTGTAQTCWK